jgi:hypothetical protein
MNFKNCRFGNFQGISKIAVLAIFRRRLRPCAPGHRPFPLHPSRYLLLRHALETVSMGRRLNAEAAPPGGRRHALVTDRSRIVESFDQPAAPFPHTQKGSKLVWCFAIDGSGPYQGDMSP